jgi:RND family efflux transporter MFP subunit
MAERPLYDLIRYVRRLADGNDAALTDAELLSRFAERRDEAAFEALVWRHGQLIWGVCQRMLRNRQDAEDVFQATFLVLARKARSVRKREAIGAWLYKVANRIALELRRKNQAANLVPILELHAAEQFEDAERADLRRTLDEEIACLPSKYRLAAILRYLEGKTTVETALILGCPVGTVLSRLAWVRRRLRTRLVQRGVGFALVLSAASASSEGAASASTQCMLATVSAAVAFTSSRAAKTGRSVLLAQGALRAMLMTKLATASLALLGLITTAAGIGFAVWPGPGRGVSTAAAEEDSTVQLARAGAQEANQTKADKAVDPDAQGKANPQGGQLPEVTFVRPISRMVVDHANFTGRTEASQTVTFRPQITARLEKIEVKPGSVVKQGDVLFQLDSSIARADYEKAAAELKRAQAIVEQARVHRERTKQLSTKNLTSSQELLASDAKVAEAQASLSAAQAGVERARFDVDATQIKAPIAGRVGHMELDVGNVVGPNSKLATLVSLSPIYVYFDIDEITFRSVHRYLQNAKAEKPLIVLMQLSGDTQPLRPGALESIDNSFDPKTGTVRARAKFPNDKDEILPGMFANVQLSWGEPREAILIPEHCIQANRSRNFVFVITPENVVEQRAIKVGKVENEGRAILSGLTPKDRVMDKVGDNHGTPVTAGTRVRATEVKATKTDGR